MPVIEKEEIRKSELVELIKLDSSLKLDIRYATSNNFLGRLLYKEAKAFLQEPVAEDLVKVNKELQKRDYGLLIYDGYRPWSVTKIFWDETVLEKRKFVADPEIGSNHNRGTAVDLGLYDLKTGKSLPMPCEFDTFSEEAFPSYKGGTDEEKRNRDFLIQIMEKDSNFKVHPYEFWHFDHKDCKKYQIMDVAFHNLKLKD